MSTVQPQGDDESVPYPVQRAAVRAFHDIGIPLEQCSHGRPHLCVSGDRLLLHAPLRNPWITGESEYPISEATRPEFVAELVEDVKEWLARREGSS